MRGSINSGKDFASERGNPLGETLHSFCWVFQPCEILSWYNRTLKSMQNGFGEESLSNIFPGQLQPNTLLWPPNKESTIIIYHSCLLLIAQHDKIELHKWLYSEWCGWSSLGAGGTFDSPVHFYPVQWLHDATWGSECGSQGDWETWRAQSRQHHLGVTREAFSSMGHAR